MTRKHFSLGLSPEIAPGAGAVLAGDLLFVSGLPLERLRASPEIATTPTAQAELALEELRRVLATAGGGLDDVVELVSFHGDARDIESVLELASVYFPSDPPAWTPLAVSAQVDPGVQVTVNAIARLGDQPKRSYVPDTIAWWRRYSIAAGCEKGGLLFVAGQYGSDADGNVNTPGDHAGQARNALNRVGEICELSGADLADVIDVTSAHQDPRWIDAVQELYESEFFEERAGPAFPAWTAVGVPGLLRHGMVGQYRAIADQSGGRRLGSTPSELGWNGAHIAGAARKDGSPLIAVSGIAATDRHGDLIGSGDAEAQAHSAFKLMRTTLAGFGASLDDLVQLTSFHLDPASMKAAIAVSSEYLRSEQIPAWGAAGMTGTRRRGELHLIKGLALKDREIGYRSAPRTEALSQALGFPGGRGGFAWDKPRR